MEPMSNSLRVSNSLRSNYIFCIVHGILQAKIFEWVTFPFSRGSSQPRDWTQNSCIAGGFFISWTIREAPHPYTTTGKNIALTLRTFVGKVMSLLFNILSRYVIAFLPRSKHLLISRLQSPSTVILESKKIKSYDTYQINRILIFSEPTIYLTSPLPLFLVSLYFTFTDNNTDLSI